MWCWTASAGGWVALPNGAERGRARYADEQHRPGLGREPDLARLRRRRALCYLPKIYAILFSALYIPLLTLIFGLIFRGVAFEFRATASKKTPWNRAFFVGSLVAVFTQGLTLGGYLSGTKVVDGHFGGGALDWLNPFSLMVGFALIAGYMLLGSTYLILKTTARCRSGPIGRHTGQLWRWRDS